MEMKHLHTTDAHRAFRDDLVDLLHKHAGDLRPVEILALAAHMIGQIIAYQDRGNMTADEAMKIIVENISLGNREAMEDLFHTAGSA